MDIINNYKIILLFNIIFIILFLYSIYDRIQNGKYYQKSKKKNMHFFELYGNGGNYENYINHKNLVYDLIDQYNKDKDKDLFNKLTYNPLKHFARGLVYGSVLSGTLFGGMRNAILFSFVGPVFDFFV